MSAITSGIPSPDIDPGVRAPLVLGNHDYASVTDAVCGIDPGGPVGWRAP